VTTPVVSVVVPTYQRAGLIEASVASLLAQTGVDFEVVVVDDGSTDDTLERLTRIRDSRLRVIAATHGGVAAARNRGVAACLGRYVAFHDSDDEALPGRLALPVAVLSNRPDLGLVIMNGLFLAPEDGGDGAKPWIKREVTETLTDEKVAGRTIGVAEVFRWNLGQLQGMCFTRAAIDAVGPFDTSFRILDDLDLVLRVAARFPAVFVDEPVFRYRRHAGGIARDRTTVSEEAIRIADKLVSAHPVVLPRLGRTDFLRRQARRHARLARARLRDGDALGARLALRQARELRPLNLRYRLEALWLRLRPRS
jgi:glycosyltransferase involved in cell wall biosynthesis